jgi:hypothetical protein
MKKVLFTLVLALFSLCTVSAQMSLRLFLGLNSSTLTDIDSANFDSKVGYQIGGDLQFGSKFYVQPGLQLEFVSNTIIDPRTNLEEDYKRTNLAIPVIVGYSFGGAESDWGFRVFTGPNAVFNLSEKTEDESVFEDLDLNSVTWRWKAGAGVDFLSIFFVDLGYQFGLSEVFKDLEESPKSNVFYGNAGVRLRF